jgi:CheY-like chemotaxis protein
VTTPRTQILFVDDSPIQTQSFRRALDGSDYDLVTAANIAQAVAAAQNRGFDFVIIDYLIGDERGDDCVRELRAYAQPHTKHFLYTTDADAFRRYRELGFDGVLMLKGKASVRTQVDTIARSISRMRASSE